MRLIKILFNERNNSISNYNKKVVKKRDIEIIKEDVT